MARFRRFVGRHVDELERAMPVPSDGVRGGALQVDTTTDPERDDAFIATAGLDDLASLPAVFGLPTADPLIRSRPAVRSALSELEDRRTFHPDRVLKTGRGAAARLATPTRASSPVRASAPFSVGSTTPRSVIICVRRKMRKQVLLAKGKGGGRHRRPRRSPDSAFWCFYRRY